MPSQKKNEQYEDYVENSDDDIYATDLDEDGNIFIDPDLYNLSTDHTKIQWTEAANEDIVNLYEYIIQYRNDFATSHILEKITFNKFLKFVANCSFQIK